MTPDAHVVDLARETAARHGLDGDLVCAVIEQETGWNTYAIRYERSFQSRYVNPLPVSMELSPTETIARSISWGLMQVMGQVAREFGYNGDFPALCVPLTGVEIGCRVLAHKMDLAHGNVGKALALWNGGANSRYGAEVLARINHKNS